MMKISMVCILLLTLTNPSFSQASQNPTDDGNQKDAARVERLVREWFLRLNGLTSWFISMDGKEETDEVVNRFAELYSPDALQLMGPGEDQIGMVTLTRRDQIKKWAQQFATKYVESSYRIDMQTVQEKTTQLFLTSRPPWGGDAAAVEITAIWKDRETRRQFMARGAVFFQFVEDKIQRLTLYVSKDDTAEVFR